MIPAGARHAEPPATRVAQVAAVDRTAPVVVVDTPAVADTSEPSARCSPRCVGTVARQRKFPSSPGRTAPSTARTVSSGTVRRELKIVAVAVAVAVGSGCYLIY